MGSWSSCTGRQRAVVPWLVGLICLVSVAGLDNRTILTRQLLQDYLPTVPPTMPSGPVEVEVDMALIEISQVSTTGEYIELEVWWRLYWTDPRLSWAAEYGVPSLKFEKSQVWVPDVFVFEQIEVEDQHTTVTAYQDGAVYLSIPRLMKIGCPMQLKSFPHDTQFCNFTLGSWNQPGTVLDVLPKSRNPEDMFEPSNEAADRHLLDLDRYKPLQSWDLAAVRVIWENQFFNCCPGVPFPVVVAQLELERATATYLGGMVWPLIIVTAIGLFSLWMPAPVSGARPALSVTILLTTATVYFVASRATPHSNASTTIGRLYLFCLGMSVILVLLSILTTGLNLIHPEDEISSRHILHYFQFFDKSQTGTLSGGELGNALESLGLTEKEQAVIKEHFGTGNNGEVSLEQWKAFGELARKDDDIAIYHNNLVQKLVIAKIESDLKHHGRMIGKQFDPTTATQLNWTWKRRLSEAVDTLRRKSSARSSDTHRLVLQATPGRSGSANGQGLAHGHGNGVAQGEESAGVRSQGSAVAGIVSPLPATGSVGRRSFLVRGGDPMQGKGERGEPGGGGDAGVVGSPRVTATLGTAEARAGVEGWGAEVGSIGARTPLAEVGAVQERWLGEEGGHGEEVMPRAGSNEGSRSSRRLQPLLTAGAGFDAMELSGLPGQRGSGYSVGGGRGGGEQIAGVLHGERGSRRRVTVEEAQQGGWEAVQAEEAQRRREAAGTGRWSMESSETVVDGQGRGGVRHGVGGVGRQLREKLAVSRRHRLGNNQAFKSASRKIGQMLDPHRQVQTSAQKEGRYVAALLDRYARRLLPVAFVVYLLMEFLGAWSGTNSLSLKKGYDSPSGVRKVLIEYQDRRSSPGEVRCYRSFPKTLRVEDQFAACSRK